MTALALGFPGINIKSSTVHKPGFSNLFRPGRNELEVFAAPDLPLTIIIM